ncbi:hypothetical protein LSCM1_01653 [Leishmania martiniquensis]|uniref:Uncharacterized protein n=1 Tax=Leishmania martiniquensis TaxID=1580590 RepID=A0A836GE05_9TRYP|nr:hypothetical protein LSCM1_01653 [Leishmania martiniquensis]
MSVDGRKSRASMLRSGATPLSTPAAAPFFSESPVPLPSLDALRKTDVLVRAFYASRAPTPPPALPPADSSWEKVCVLPSAVVTAVGERETAGEVFCATLAREVVEAAANLFSSRSLDRLVGAYAACAAWDDMRDVVAASFSQQDYGEGVAMSHQQGPLSVATSGLPPHSDDTAAPVPLFLRSALSLAGVSTRTPSCALTPQSSITPPPLCAHHRVPSKPAQLLCPLPPASVPVDAYCRYIMALEAVAAPPTALGLAPSSHSSRLVRLRGTKAGTQYSEKRAAAEKTVKPPLASSPQPPVSIKRSKGGNRMGTLHVTETSDDAALTAPDSGARGGPASGAGVQEPSPDALTTAMRLAPPVLFGDSAENLPHAERSVVRVLDTGSSTAQPGNSETEKRHAVKVSPRGGGVMLVVEDRLLSVERTHAALLRSDSRKDGVVCRVASPLGDTDAATEEEESAVQAGASSKDATEEPSQRDRRTKRHASAVAAAQAKEATRAREEWLSSFYATADTAAVAPLLDQVQVYPSAGVTVMAANDSAAAPSPRRSANKTAVGNTVLTSGGEFQVPADRMALCSFDDRGAPLRKGNGTSARAPQPHRDNTLAARPIKAPFSGAKVREQ